MNMINNAVTHCCYFVGQIGSSYEYQGNSNHGLLQADISTV